MAAPRWLARFNRRATNRLLGPVATRLPGFGILIHTGRTSRRAYRTPINVFRRPGGYVIALTYGSRSDWVRNVLAQGGATVLTQGRTYRLTRPRLIVDPQRRPIRSPLVRTVLGLIHVSEFLDLDVDVDRRPPSARTDHPQCCIAGCGPAGAILGLLLARAGVDVLVLEKHADFLRDFRGDTIHPSTLELLDQLGLADRFLQLPHTRASMLRMRTDADQELDIEFSRLPSRFPFVALVPQWDFLNFITAEAARYPTFHLLMQAEAIDLLHDGATVHGLRYRVRDAEREVHADLVVGADGRGSLTRAVAALPGVASKTAFDVLWFRLSRRPDDPVEAVGRIGSGHFVATFNRGDYWQIAYTIGKGADAHVREAGLSEFRATIARLLPQLADRVGELQDWDQVKLLSVRADRLLRWYRPGYLAIGDAAHAMSPVGGVGINVAIQDAVAAANTLWAPLANGTLSTTDLARVQRQRELPVRIIQGLQGGVQRLVFQRALADDTPFRLPWLAEVLLRAPLVRDIPGRLVALGMFRPRVLSPSAPARSIDQG